ncbi:MAG: glucose/galactose MFS transporter, partial [Lysobacter sp.]|nr:glucose/galactose MFS transporter [Lysobacter sp.]
MSRHDMSYTAALAVVTIIFFTWGGLTSLNDVLIPHLKNVFQMNYTESMLIQSTFFGAYFLMSLPASKVVAMYGYKNSIVIGLIVAAIGAAMFFPAARLPSYPLFLSALFVLASGITLLQVSANPYISLLGDPAGAPSRLNLAQALNSLGTTVFPYVIGPLILAGAALSVDELAAKPVAEQIAYRAHEAASVQIPYMIIAAGLLLLAVFVYTMRIPSLAEATESADPVH